MKKIISIILMILFVSGCGGSTKSRGDVTPIEPPVETPPEDPIESITMVLDEVYQVNKYDELNKTSSEARAEIVHFADGGTAVVLREGSAILTKY